MLLDALIPAMPEWPEGDNSGTTKGAPRVGGNWSGSSWGCSASAQRRVHLPVGRGPGGATGGPAGAHGRGPGGGRPAGGLAVRGEVDITQGGHVVDIAAARGPVRIRRHRPG